MEQQKFYTPLKIGLLAVVVAYFLFTLHGMFTLSWIGEWDRMGGGSFGTMILVEDISATIGLIFRFLASILAFGAVVTYLVKKSMAKPTAFKAIRWVIAFEGIYWLGLIATAGYEIVIFGNMITSNGSVIALKFLILTVIPTIFESIILPITLFILAFKLNPNQKLSNSIKWSLVATTILIAVFWLINTGIWVGVIDSKGIEYLTAFPEHLLSFIVTTVGMAALTIYSGYFATKSRRTETLKQIKVRPVGTIVVTLGLFFLWNYFSWVFFAENTWNDWYAWFLGHNMDLWMLTLPLLGLPLLFGNGDSE